MPSMPNIQMPQLKMPQMGGNQKAPETPQQIGQRIKPLLRVKEVKPTSLHAINVTFRYEGKEPLKRLVLESYYNDYTFTSDMEGPIRPDMEFMARFKDERIDTYRMDFAGFTWAVKEATLYETGTYKNYSSGSTHARHR